LAVLATFVRFVDRLNDVIGRGVAWLTLAMVLITFVVVILRYIYAIGWVWMQESYVWLHGIVFMMAAGYTLLHNGHVRVDIIYRSASFLVSFDYVAGSWLRLEESREAGGLPGLFLLKSVIPAFCVLLGLQGLALAGRSLLSLAGNEEFMPVEEELEGL
jgi:TRAP-type mannitol/chloroaromatic compound transport system permease small subunit